MNTLKLKTLAALVALPFLVTLLERLVIKPAVVGFPLHESSIHLWKVSIVTLMLFAVSAYFGNTYGLEIDKKLRKIISGMFVVLMSASYFFLWVLQLKGLFTAFAVVHLMNWIITVFREEFILRGVIQTQSSLILDKKLFKISHSIWFTTILFSLWHLVNLTIWPWHVVAIQMISCIPSGIILGLIREKTGNTLLSYLLHICGDLLFFSFYTLLFGTLFFTLL